MFWNNFVLLCNSKNKTPTSVISGLNISRGSVTHWKSGKVPHHSTLIQIADYFGVSVDYLLKGDDDTAESREKIPNIGGDAEMMSDGTLKRLMDYLKSVGWSDSQIVALLDYIVCK